MIEWAETESGLRVTDGADGELSVRSPDLSVEASGADVPAPVEETLGCRAGELRLPGGPVSVRSLSGNGTRKLGDEAGTLSLPSGEYAIDLDAGIGTCVRVGGPAEVRRAGATEGVVIALPDSRRVALGFRGRRRPAGTITVPPTPDGLATAITHCASALTTTGPARSAPRRRAHPPLVETGDAVAVPPAIEASTPDTGVRILVPPAFEDLFPVAPLAYYLGATVRTGDASEPVVRTPVDGGERALIDTERDAARLLRKAFFLDCLVRDAGRDGGELAEANLLSVLNLDAVSLQATPPGERLAKYISVPYGALERRLPDWHLSTYVTPGPGRIEALPYLLDDLSTVYLPQTTELSGSELVRRSLDDFYRGGPGEVASVDVVKPELRSGRVHGWLAYGTPIDVFKATTTAYENRLAHAGADRDGVAVTVVVNDDAMDDEPSDAAAIYRERADDLPIDLTVREALTCDELASVFEAETDFVHYIGHCETDGLRCTDGYLRASSLSASNARTFFLNACGSYHQGLGLVERGSVAGGVTVSHVLDNHAATVGSTFARLLVHGFGLERAMCLARRRIMMGKDYAVVGDGTYAITEGCEDSLPATVSLRSIEDDRYLLTYDQFSSRHAGSRYRPPVGDDGYAYLCGNRSEFTLDREEVASFLSRTEVPVVYDDDVYWSSDLGDRLRDAPAPSPSVE